MRRIFVYGTLIWGEGNHRLLATAQFVCVTRTAAEYTLVNLGGCPALVERGGCAVRGEIYDVDDATLAAVDRLEGHPRLYRRTPIRLRDGGVVDAYLMPPDRARIYPIIESGNWRDLCELK